MVYVFRIASPALANGTPASDMDGSEWTFQDLTLESATSRALRRLEQTFCYASKDRVEATSLHFVGEYPSRRAYEEAADTLPVAAESGVALAPAASDTRAAAYETFNAAARAAYDAVCKRHDYSDGDMCSRCDALRPMRKVGGR